MRTHLVTLYLVILCSPLVIFSQQRSFQVQKFQVENGLPENSILSLLQDYKGYLWIGTQNGLVRYDGQTLKTYAIPKTGTATISLSSIRALYEDSAKRLWIGTLQQGIYYLDRATDKIRPLRLEHGDTSLLRTSMISAINNAENGNLLVFMLEFTNRQIIIQEIDPETRTTYTIVKIAFSFTSNLSPVTFTETPDNRIWVARDGMIHYLDPRTHKLAPKFRFSPGNGLAIADIAADIKDSSRIWINTYRPETQQRTDTIYQVDLKSGIFRKVDLQWNDTVPYTRQVYFAFSDSSKRLWFTGSNGLSRYDYAKGRFMHYPIPASLESGPFFISTLTVAPAGDIWFVTPGILYHFNPENGRYERFIAAPGEPNALPTVSLNRVLVDRGGTLWLGSANGGLFRRDPTASVFRYINRETGAARGFRGRAYSLTRHQNQVDFWLNTTEGLSLWKPALDTFIPVKQPAGALSGGFSTVYETDRDGNVLGSAAAGGLLMYNPARNTWSNLRHDPGNPNSISSNAVNTLMTDREGMIWVGTRDSGLCQVNLKSGKVTRYPFIQNMSGTKPTNGELDDAAVISIFEDSKGVIWVGTNIGGLNRLDKTTGRFTSFLDPDAQFQTVISIFEDRKNRLWAGTYIGGLFLFDRNTGKYTRYTEADGLSYNGVNNIFEDRQGNIWLTSFRGLTRMEPEKPAFTRFTTSIGLPENVFTLSAAEDRNGRFYLTARNGLMVFDANQIARDTVPPLVTIQSFSYRPVSNGQSGDTIIFETDREDDLLLAHDENRIQIQFAPMHFNNMAFNECSYMLEGYDKEWIPAGSQRSVRYTNLSPGKYRFLVKARNGDGVWSAEPATFSFEIKPPWWQTIWAYLVYALLLAASIRGYISWRSRKLQEEKKILEETVAARTRDLQTSIRNLEATQKQLIQSEKMASLGELTAGIAHEIQNPLNFVNNFAEVNEELLTEASESLDKSDLEDVRDLLTSIRENEGKIRHHGKRADSIVKSMLQHSRTGTGEKEPTDINDLVDEYLRLSFHGYRAKEKLFNARIDTAFDPAAGTIQAIPQDLGRVLLNVFNNAFYAMAKRNQVEGDAFESILSVTTQRTPTEVTISIRDNGGGIPAHIVDKIFNPFFTTKPTGEGTGLGLSLSYEIITRGHGGRVEVQTSQGESTTFTIGLPAS